MFYAFFTPPTSMWQATKDNYFEPNTYINFWWLREKAVPARPPDYISSWNDEVSEYWYESDKLIRQSKHWGFVGNSLWPLRPPYLTQWAEMVVSPLPLIGFSRWEDIFLLPEFFGRPMPPVSDAPQFMLDLFADPLTNFPQPK